MLKAVREVEQKLHALYAKPAGLDLEELCLRLKKALASDNWDAIAGREWRYVPLCLTMGSPALLEDPKFMKIYLSRLNMDASRLALRHLIRLYLEAFDPNSRGIRALGNFLAARPDLGDEWAQRSREVELFSPDKAPTNLGKEAIAVEEPVDFLSNMGFERSLETAGLAGYAFLEALRLLEQKLRKTPSIGVVQKVTCWGMKGEKELRYPSVAGIRAKLAETLLMPWTAHDPPQDVKDFILRFILDNYRDLRINRNLWNGVGEEAQQVMMRWLTKESLEWFLNVVDATTTRHEVKHMWPARRKFWKAYYRYGYMQQAWVVFGSVGALYATRKANMASKDRASMLSFGRLQSGGGISTEHAVLLMRIGDLTIADWNFSGKCHIWRPGNDKTPLFYRPVYGKADLTYNADLSQVHYHSGRWQKPVYDFIRSHTGVSMPTSDYM
jgi:hypothetical protein